MALSLVYHSLFFSIGFILSFDTQAHSLATPAKSCTSLRSICPKSTVPESFQKMYSPYGFDHKGRGGQSALRFARLRTEKRHNYVRKVAELATQFFITNDRPNISGLILAGSADFKTELGQSDMFDPRLQEKIIKTVDVSYGGENGFNQVFFF